MVKKTRSKKVVKKQSTKSKIDQRINKLIDENRTLKKYIQDIKEQIPKLESLLSDSSQKSIKLGDLFEAVKHFLSVKEQHIINLYFEYGFYDKNKNISYSKHDSLENVFKNFFDSESSIGDYYGRELLIGDYKNYSYVLYNNYNGDFILLKNEKEIENYLLKEIEHIKNSEILYINDKNLFDINIEYNIVFKKMVKSKTNSKSKVKKRK